MQLTSDANMLGEVLARPGEKEEGELDEGTERASEGGPQPDEAGSRRNDAQSGFFVSIVMVHPD